MHITNIKCGPKVNLENISPSLHPSLTELLLATCVQEERLELQQVFLE